MVDGPKGRDDMSGCGAGEVGGSASVVVASTPPEAVRPTGLGRTFLATGPPDAVTAARERAGAAPAAGGR
ncbi:hypothetical protein ACIRFH_10985 [Streptomyces sp. NPDC093586]|uniref:hypothetical protein n=1 Tax=Streptomyces sp. NPDC093586 TaxID=3366042 RepID=UPI003826A1A5